MNLNPNAVNYAHQTGHDSGETRQLLQSLLWNRHDLPSLEHSRLYQHQEGFTLTGTVVASLDTQPLHCSYEVKTTSGWKTREVRIHLSNGTKEQSLHLKQDEDNRWWSSGTELRSFAGMNDIDLGITPSTNTLPIRRLQLKPGESASMIAVWIQFPSLTVSPLPQRYTRTGERSYRYESNNGAYQADLEVDEHGLVTKYADVWSRTR
ncbi:putative glycolipid-binding domain-containing protein [Paenibacillus glucanolyticus]|uniref:putative glycolipid-binding domain-containing protein n=1 Tax=Paenibacillus glucanolyticus TaxID=59843 RepID=UPI00128CCB9E|nr:putative glycolipid-binding domain-containing protein [Paenibacillus glucanolyticus]MPY16028.1 putative glycolipid-binding domain-containing protein [Paenibacillus glucanolyticus]